MSPWDLERNLLEPFKIRRSIEIDQTPFPVWLRAKVSMLGVGQVEYSCGCSHTFLGQFVIHMSVSQAVMDALQESKHVSQMLHGLSLNISGVT